MAAKKLPLPGSYSDLIDVQQKLLAELETRHTKKQGPQKFTQFVSSNTTLKLSPSQYAFAKAAFDGEDLLMDERFGPLTKKIFGDNVISFTKEQLTTVVAVCGARSGKTYVFGALRMLHLALTVDLSTLAPGEHGFWYLVAPNLVLAAQSMNYVRGAIAASPRLSSMLMGKPNKESVRLKRPDGRLVEITVRAASRGGASVRGGSICGAFLDECAFFRSDNYEVTDNEIFDAIEPRILPGGQIVIASTPWTETGLLYKFFKKNWDHPVDMVAAHAPTLLMLNTPRNRQVVERVRKDNPENASREYDAQFVGSDAETFFNSQWIDSSVDKRLVLPKKPNHGDSVRFGCDLGFVNDCSALVGVHAEPDGMHTVADILELRPSRQNRLKPSEVFSEFSKKLKEHHASYVMADAHYRESMWEHLSDSAMALIDAPKEPSEAFMVAKSKLHEGKCRLPDHPRLVAQLKEVRFRRGNGGKIHMIQPHMKMGDGKSGGHGDIVSAWVLAMYQSAGEEVAAEPPKPGTPEHSRMLSGEIRDRRRREVQASTENGNRRRPGDRFRHTH